jgi:hypothetical protein
MTFARGDMRVELRGPMFSPNSPRKVKVIIRDGLAILAEAGAGFVQSQLYPGHGYITGFLHGSVAGHVVTDLLAIVDAGQLAQGGNVVYARPIEQRYGMFKFGTEKLQAQDMDKIFGEPIAKALNG